MEIASGKWRLTEIIEEQALLSAYPHTVTSFHPRQHGGITVESMCEVGIGATLGKQRGPGLIHQKSRHTYDPVRGIQYRREAELNGIRIVVGVSRRESAIYTK